MAKYFLTGIIWGLVLLIFISAAGCASQQQRDERELRLLANQAQRLQLQLEQKQQELNRLQQVLVDCIEQNQALEERIQHLQELLSGRFQENFQEILETVLEQISELQAENEALKKQIEELQQ